MWDKESELSCALPASPSTEPVRAAGSEEKFSYETQFLQAVSEYDDIQYELRFQEAGGLTHYLLVVWQFRKDWNTRTIDCIYWNKFFGFQSLLILPSSLLETFCISLTHLRC
jgi:hypothetical protein